MNFSCHLDILQGSTLLVQETGPHLKLPMHLQEANTLPTVSTIPFPAYNGDFQFFSFSYEVNKGLHDKLNLIGFLTLSTTEAGEKRCKKKVRLFLMKLWRKTLRVWYKNMTQTGLYMEADSDIQSWTTCLHQHEKSTSGQNHWTNCVKAFRFPLHRSFSKIPREILKEWGKETRFTEEFQFHQFYTINILFPSTISRTN